jgi:hypothetical protein
MDDSSTQNENDSENYTVRLDENATSEENSDIEQSYYPATEENHFT